VRFLVCLDQTAFARSILPAVKQLAAAAGAKVELITVVRAERHGGEPWSGQRSEPLKGTAIDEARQILEVAASEFTPPADVAVVGGNSAAAAIVHHARVTHPGIIALATHSRGSLGEAALGSTAPEVTRAGVAPVLLFHPLAAAGMRTGDIPLGIYAFTADGDPAGEVIEVTAERLRLRRVSGEDIWLPASVAGAVTTGRLLLEVSSADMTRFVQPSGG